LVKNLSVKVIFFGPLERWTGHKEMSADGSTIREVIQALDSLLEKSLLDHLTNSTTGEIKSHFHILLNGKDTEPHESLATPVKAGDILTIVPPVGGG
jgi:molybdopterin converting factor small subunit